MKTIIDDAAGVFTLINTFTTDERSSALVVDALRRFTHDSASLMPGFAGASVHVSRDRRRVVNYVQWENVTFFEAMFGDPAAVAHMAEVRALAIAIEPVVYDVEYVGAARRT